MNKQQAFTTVVSEFRRDMSISDVKAPTRFVATAPNGAQYNVVIRWGERDPMTDAPKDLRIVVNSGGGVLFEGNKRELSQAQRAAQIATSTIRNTGYAVQGSLI